jgi:hypothetical protein
LIPPAIPEDFCYTTLPEVLIGGSKISPKFRHPVTKSSEISSPQ